MRFHMDRGVKLHYSAKPCVEYLLCMYYELKKKKKTGLLAGKQDSFMLQCKETKSRNSPLRTTFLRKKNTHLTLEEKIKLLD